MEERNKFGGELEDILLQELPVLNQDIISGQQADDFLSQVEGIWNSIDILPGDIEVIVDPTPENHVFIKTQLRVEEEEKELSRVPFDVKTPGTGKDVFRLTWLLIMETLDELFAQDLRMTGRKVDLSRLLSFQEKKYRDLNEETARYR